MALDELARAHYGVQQSLADRAAAALAELWALLDPTGIAAGWQALRLAERMFVALATHQVAAASPAPRYVAAALAEQGVPSVPLGVVAPASLAGVASDGRPLESLLAQPLIETLTQIKQGAPPQRALEIGGSSLSTIAQTQVSDAGRAAVQVAMTAEPKVFGWVRVLVPPSCGRCAILAGRWYGWNDGFERHERCDCVHVPAAEDVAGDLRTDPQGYFHSLSAADQAKYFTASGARAIRDGADINQVVNARRGARGLSRPGRLTETEQTVLRGGRRKGYLDRVDVYGRQVYLTHEGTTRRGSAGRTLGAWSDDAPKQGRYRRARSPRLMPESIYELAGDDRDEAVRLLRRFGYIT